MSEPILHHVALSVGDLSKALPWYCAVLNAGLERTVERPDLGVTVAFIVNRTVRLELFSFFSSTVLPPYRQAVDDDIRVHGTKHVAFTVSNIEETISIARSAGSAIVDGPHSSFDGGNRYVFVSDPDGVLIEFMQFK